MSKEIDSRIVELSFNNKEFENGTKQSLASLTLFKKALQMSGASAGLTTVSDKLRGMDFSIPKAAIGSLANGFLNFGTVGFTVLQRLTNAALDFAKKLQNNVLKPITTGFQEYETQINAIQTVLANTESKGTTLDDVNRALDELNTYADKTIYNFTEMTRNIGTFTAAGVDLETSTAAIKGIANLAAVSGSTSQQASTAMYQLSQALSSGTVKLMDWNSVVNAGMGGQVFQDALKETARVSGIAIDDLIDKHGSFRETLSEGWLSSEVLLQTLQKFTGDLSEEQLKTLGYTDDQIKAIIKLGETANDAATKVKTFSQLKDTLAEALQSGWTATWELIIGDFEQAKAFFTYISDTLGAMIQNSADARNEVVGEWNKYGGREHIISTIRYAFEALLSVLGPVREAFKDVFPKTLTGKDLALVTLKIREFVKSLILSEESAEKVKRLFTGIFNIFGIVGDAVSHLMNLFLGFLGKQGKIDWGFILDWLADLGDKMTNLRNSIDVAKGIDNALTWIVWGFNRARDAITEFLTMLETKYPKVFSSMRNILSEASSFITTKLSEVATWFSDFSLQPLDTEKIKGWFGSIGEQLEKLQPLADSISEFFSGLGDIFLKVQPYLDDLGRQLMAFITGAPEHLKQAAKNVNWDEVMKWVRVGLLGGALAMVTNFVKNSEAGGIIGSIVRAIIGSGTFVSNLNQILLGVKDVLDGVGDSLKAWQTNLKAKTLLTLAAAVGVLALALIAISLIPQDKLLGAMAVITGLFLNLAGSMAAYNKFGVGGATTAASLIGMAAAVLIMTIALEKLSVLDPTKVSWGIGAIYALAIAMVAFSKFISKDESSMSKGALALIAFAFAMAKMVKVIEKLAGMETDKLSKGLLATAVMLAEIGIFMRIVNDQNLSITTSVGLLIVAGALWVLADVVDRFGTLKPSRLEQGLLVMAAVLLQFGLFTRLVGNGSDVLGASVGILIITGALWLMADVLNKLGLIDPLIISNGLMTIAAALAIITVATNLMPKDMLVKAVALVILSVALYAIQGVLAIFGAMSWEQLAKGMLGLAGTLSMLALALTAMTGTLAGSAALVVAAIGLAALLPPFLILANLPLESIGVGLLAMAGIFTVLGLAGLILGPVVPVIVALGLAVALLGVGMGLAGFGMTMFAGGLATLVLLGPGLSQTLTLLVNTLVDLMPVIVQGLLNALAMFYTGVQKAAPEWGKALSAIIDAFLQVIIDATPKIGQALITLGLELIGVITTLVPALVEGVLGMIGAILEAIAEAVPGFVQSGFDILLGFLKGIRDNITEVVLVVGEIITNFLEALALVLPDIIQAGFDLLIAFLDGITDAINSNENTKRISESMLALVQTMVDGLVNGLGTLGEQFIEAIKTLAGEAIKGLLDVFQSESPSKVTTRIGKTLPEGLIVGVGKLSEKFIDTMSDLGDDAISTLTNSLDQVTNVLGSDFDLNPTVTPVMDMSDILAGGQTLDSIFNQSRSLNLSGSLSPSSRISVGGNDIKDAAGTSETVINLTQNNYSPKSLSTSEIYRNTRNQLLTLKGVVGK